MFVYKINVLEELKHHGCSSYVLLNSDDPGRRMGSTEIQKIRNGYCVGIKALESICRITGKQPGDIIEYYPDDQYDALRETDYFAKKGILAPPRKQNKNK